MVRCFLAIFPLNEEIIKKVEIIKKDIKNFLIGKAVEKENLHITISFFGEVNEKELKEILEKTEKTVEKINGCVAFINGIKLIPNENFIRVIALEVFGLENISKEIEKNVGGDVKPPHLTIYRVKKVFEKNKLMDFCRKVKIDEYIEVKELKLIKSTLTKNGPIYEVITTFKLL
ncbi:MAG: RNA 2',3'-cyclic phosphodiesterase [Candidatus Aenigmatarchaeota archaeon]